MLNQIGTRKFLEQRIVTTVAPWLTRSLDSINQSLSDRRAHHAFLVSGVPGWGANDFGAAWVGKLLEIDKDVREAAHPDALWIKPESPQSSDSQSRQGDGSGSQNTRPDGRLRKKSELTIKVDQIRELSEFVVRSISVAPRKVVLIEGIESATIAASNALLKSLEEPPPNTHLVLVTESLDLLLPTIRSRCRLVSLPTSTRSESEEWLLNNGIPKENMESLMVEYGNAPYLILNAWEQKRKSLRRQLLDIWRQPHRSVDLAATLKNEDFDELLVRWMRLAQRYAESGSDPLIHNFWADLVEARRAYQLVSTLNVQLQLERLLIKWSKLQR